MRKIGLIADTHNYFDPQIETYFSDCDEIWHAGDFGSIEIVEKLRNIAPLTGVYGNIDGEDIRSEFGLHERFICENLDIWMTHIGGHPGRYALPIRKDLEERPPDIFICGHSHILKIVRDPLNPEMLHMNPGAAGRHGFHEWRTLVRFELDSGNIRHVEVIHLGHRTD